MKVTMYRKFINTAAALLPGSPSRPSPNTTATAPSQSLPTTEITMPSVNPDTDTNTHSSNNVEESYVLSETEVDGSQDNSHSTDPDDVFTFENSCKGVYEAINSHVYWVA